MIRQPMACFTKCAFSEILTLQIFLLYLGGHNTHSLHTHPMSCCLPCSHFFFPSLLLLYHRLYCFSMFLLLLYYITIWSPSHLHDFRVCVYKEETTLVQAQQFVFSNKFGSNLVLSTMPSIDSLYKGRPLLYLETSLMD